MMKRFIAMVITLIIFTGILSTVSANSNIDKGALETGQLHSGRWGYYEAKTQRTYGTAFPDGCFTVYVSVPGSSWNSKTGCYYGISENGISHSSYIYSAGMKIEKEPEFFHKYFGAEGQ